MFSTTPTMGTFIISGVAGAQIAADGAHRAAQQEQPPVPLPNPLRAVLRWVLQVRNPRVKTKIHRHLFSPRSQFPHRDSFYRRK